MRPAAVLILLAGFVLAATCWGGCAYEPVVPPPPPPIPPTPPPPTPPEPPAPARFVDRATMEAIEVGDAVETLSELPLPDIKTPLDDGTEVWVWTIREERPDGGWVRWEVHVRDGVVALSLPY